MHHDVADRTEVTSREGGIEQDPTNTVHRSSLRCTPLLGHMLFPIFNFPGFLWCGIGRSENGNFTAALFNLLSPWCS